MLAVGETEVLMRSLPTVCDLAMKGAQSKEIQSNVATLIAALREREPIYKQIIDQALVGLPAGEIPGTVPK